MYNSNHYLLSSYSKRKEIAYKIRDLFLEHDLSRILETTKYQDTKGLPYLGHLEDNVKVHSLMVFEEVLLKPEFTISDVLTAFIHDAGKPVTRKFCNRFQTFKYYNHEHLSVLYGLDFLHYVYKKLYGYVTVRDLATACMCSVFHKGSGFGISRFVENTKYYARDVIRFIEADLTGRITDKIKLNKLSSFLNYYKDSKDIKPTYKRNRLSFLCGYFSKTPEYHTVFKKVKKEHEVIVDISWDKSIFTNKLLKALRKGYSILICGTSNKQERKEVMDLIPIDLLKDYDKVFRFVGLNPKRYYNIENNKVKESNYVARTRYFRFPNYSEFDHIFIDFVF